MKKFQLILLFFCLLTKIQAQKSAIFSINASAGYNNHSYTYNNPGWFFKIGVERKVIKHLYLNLRYWRSQSSTFPSNMHVYSFQSGQESEIINHFLGLTQEEWMGRKGKYNLREGGVLSLSTTYQFNIANKFYVAPKIGVNLIRSKDIAVGLFEAYFNSEGKTMGGKLGYDIRMSKLIGWNYGFDLGYKLNERIHFFIDCEDISDINGGGFNFFEAKNAGVGIKYFLK